MRSGRPDNVARRRATPAGPGVQADDEGCRTDGRGEPEDRLWVINEEAGVAASTASRVSEAIELLGFERNDLARSLRRGHSSATLGLVIEDLANPFYSADGAGDRSCRARARVPADHGVRARGPRPRARGGRGDAAPPRRRAAGGPGRARPPLRGGRRRPHARRVPRPAARRDGCRHRAARQSRWRAAGRRASAEARPHEDRVRGRQRRAVHGRERGSRVTARRSRPRAPSWTGAVRTGNRDAAQSQSPSSLLALPDGIRPTALFTANNRNTRRAARAAGHGDRLALVGFDDFELADLLGVTVVARCRSGWGSRRGPDFARLAGDHRPPRHVTIPCTLVSRGTGEVRALPAP